MTDIGRFLKIDASTSYVVAIQLGDSPRPGFDLVEQTEAVNAQVGVGWSYIDGAFSDTTAKFRPIPKQPAKNTGSAV